MRQRAVVAAILLLSASSAHAQVQQAQQLTHEADSLFAREEWLKAAPLYRAITSTSPGEGKAWYRLGVSLQESGAARDAIAPLGRALQLGFNVPGAQWRLARAHAALGDTRAALDALEQAGATGALPPALFDDPKEFSALKSEPRYVAIVNKVQNARFPCRERPESRQFDFWIGSWNVTTNGQTAGENEIQLALEKCLLIENWRDGYGGMGKSFNFFDPASGSWRQLWVDDGGRSTDYTGAWRDGAMDFSAKDEDLNGAPILRRMRFFPLAKDSVRQLIEKSSDGGKTWKPDFDGLYVRKAQRPASSQ